jgi:hypothetical protein
MRLEGLGKLKNQMIPSGIEPATIRLIARDRVPLWKRKTIIN